MITNEEIQLSKMSYTDKDFASIYPDLLDLAKQLTNKWDPSTSNESDPGVVLLKEAAFIADHSNYNIDKNVLENFLPSATQEESVRNLMEINGYNPKYYVSATGSVNISYKSSQDETTGENFIPFSIPAYTLQISDDDGHVYTQLNDLAISIENLSVPTNFIEGTISTLSVNGNENIVLDNLDSENKIYFPVQHVAQNGIFIKNSTDTDNNLWTKVDYLQVQDLRSNVYKVGYDSSKDLPYVEFPSDIATIIGSGLNIRYIVTSGDGGNIGANKLNAVISPDTIDITTDYQILCDDFSINNPSAITNGKNPETIDEMYQSFKKVIGTFNTLVTCRDYSNAVNVLEDSTSGQNLVGNSVVTDVNSDYNNSLKVVCLDEYGLFYDNISVCKGISKFTFVTDTSNPQNGDIKFENSKFSCYNNGVWSEISSISYETFVSATEAMNRFDLCLYALNIYSESSYSDTYPNKALDSSFTPINSTIRDVIKEELTNGYKCITHNFKNNSVGDIICFKNYLPLNVMITPYSKVTKTEKGEILQNIYRAINNNFNSSKVDFGEEISWDNVYDVILNCDSRIKNVRLEDFEYNTVAMVKTTDSYEEKPLSSNQDIVRTLIAKNVLAGRVCLFDFNEDFVYDYGEVIPYDSSEEDVNEYSDISSLSSEVEINLASGSESDLTALASDIYSVEIGYSEVTTLNDQLALKLCQNPDVEVGTATTITINGNSTYNFSDEKYILKVYKINEDSTRSWLTEFECYSGRYFVFANNTSNNIVLTYTGDVEPSAETIVGKDDITITNYVERTSYTEGNLLLNEYELKENENITIESPNWSSDVIYPAYAYYKFENSDGTSSIPANTDYTLSGVEKLTIVWKVSGVADYVVYSAGDTIKTNFELKPNQPGDDTYTVEYTDKITQSIISIDCKVCAADESISHRELLKTVLNSVDVPCYWITNNTGNTLFSNLTQETEVILDVGEYFFYSNSTLDYIVTLGPGTKLIRTDNYQWSISDPISAESIQNNGFSSNPAWVHRDFSQNNFEIQEMAIVNLSQGDVLSLINCTSTASAINNDWQIFNTQVRYTVDGETSYLPQNDYYIRSRLDLNTSNQSLTLYKTDNSTQEISFVYSGGTGTIVPDNVSNSASVNFNTDLNLIGGDNINFDSISTDILNIKKYDWSPVEYRKIKYTELADTDVISSSGTYYTSNHTLVTSSQLSAIITALGSDKTYAHYKTLTVAYIGELYTKTTYDPDDPDSYVTTTYDKASTYTMVLSDDGHIILPLQYHKVYSDSENADLEVINSNNYVIPMLFTDTTGSSSISNKISIAVNSDNYYFEIKELNKTVTSPSVSPDKFVLYLYELIQTEYYTQLTSTEKSLISGQTYATYKTTSAYTLLGKLFTLSGTTYTELSDSTTITTAGAYYRYVQNPSEINDNIEIDISVLSNTEGGTVTIYQPVVYTSINSNINTNYSYTDIIDEINSLISKSTNPEIRPYFINKPENTLAIQDEDFSNPNIFWDKNNVANNITIGQIDILNSDIDISKSMRNY